LLDDERPTQMRWFTAALGVITLKDLHNHEILRGAVAYAATFSQPFRGVPQIPEGRWVEPLVNGSQMLGTIAAVLLITQRHVRWGAGILLALYGYVFLANHVNYTNNGYLHLLCLGLVFAAGVSPMGRTPAAVRTMGRVLFTVVYLTAAIVKLEPNWLSGYLMEQAARHYHYIYATRIGFYDPQLFRWIAISSVGVELFLAFAPWSRRRWPYAAALAMAFHGIIELILPVRLFSYLMIASFLLSAPADRVAPIKCLRWLRRPAPAAAIGVTLVAVFNVISAQILGAYPLVEARHERTVIALAIVALLLWHFDSSPSVDRSTRALDATALKRERRLRGAIVIAWTTAHLALAAKPWFGGGDEFAWRMFTEDLKLEVSMIARWDDGDWTDSDLYGAQDMWSSRGYRHHWSSWGEQRDFIRDYAAWLIANDDHLKAVRLRVRYQRNREPWGYDEIALSSPHEPPLSHAE
jgi:hypothetical protein